jgi:hypothetical protein
LGLRGIAIINIDTGSPRLFLHLLSKKFGHDQLSPFLHASSGLVGVIDISTFHGHVQYNLAINFVGEIETRTIHFTLEFSKKH